MAEPADKQVEAEEWNADSIDRLIKKEYNNPGFIYMNK